MFAQTYVTFSKHVIRIERDPINVGHIIISKTLPILCGHYGVFML